MCEIAVLAVGNADCIVVRPPGPRAVIIDVGNQRILEDYLLANSVRVVDRIYITHNHLDHAPPVERLQEFVTAWLDRNSNTAVCVPEDYFRSAIRKAQESGDPEKTKRVEGAIRRLQEYRQQKILFVYTPAAGAEKYQRDDVVISMLHPDPMFDALCRKTENESSVILRVEYGSFRALLLADLEGAGVEYCLQLPEAELRANVVKIPHHGAWPANDTALRKLLALVGAQVAVLSVGSTNPHGHVKPELFRELLETQDRTGLQFLCTEVTRTCAWSNQKRARKGKRGGLPKPKRCGGHIRLKAHIDGRFEVLPEGGHSALVKSIRYAACERRAELGPIPVTALSSRKT